MWHHLYIDDVDEALRVGTRLPDDAMAVAAIVGIQGLSIWHRFDRETGGTHYYFSPGFAVLARQYGASECPLPSAQDRSGLLFGDPTAIPRPDDQA